MQPVGYAEYELANDFHNEKAVESRSSSCATVVFWRPLTILKETNKFLS